MKSILTKREREVFKLLVENKTTSDIKCNAKTWRERSSRSGS